MAGRLFKRNKESGAERKAPLVPGYDYSTAETREATVEALFHKAKSARTVVEAEWTRYNDYYNFIHDATAEVKDWCRDNDVPWLPACLPDAWINVESQIDPGVPEPEFRGRDDDQDSAKARQREYAVRYICENNRLNDMNTRNERRLLKYGDAFWKAYWDAEMRCGVNEGDIRVKDIPVDAIYPDPAVRDGTIQDGQYVDYVYRLHKVRFVQLFGRELKEKGIDPADLFGAEYENVAGLFDMTTAIDDVDDTVQVLEHWFRQPEAGEDDGGSWEAGAVGCSIQAGGRELRYIPNYWKKTGKQCRLFPFVHYWRVQDENRFWNKSELFPILDLIDTADRKLAMGILGDAMLANDIILAEEGALADGAEITNEPGAVVTTKPGRINSVRRLGGVNSLSNSAVGVDWLRGQIERANRNYETSMGKEAQRVNTATGMAMLRQDAQGQADIKKSDRDRGFERLYELLDWLALEFFDDDRLLYIGADEEHDREAVAVAYNADALSRIMPAVLDENGETVREEWTYWPRVDVSITASDNVIRGKQATLQALQTLTQAQITPDNWKLWAAQLELLDLPGKQDIIEDWRQKFEAPQMPEQAMPGMDMGGGGPAPTGGGNGLPSVLRGVPTGV
jgi:hypothetical protein